MLKILYVTTISDTMGFFTSHIKMLLDEGHTVDMACNVGKEINKGLLDKGCKVYNIEFQRSPFNGKNYLAYRKLKKMIQSNKYDLVHTHTPVASVCTRLACKNLYDVKVFYTAHGFHFFKGAPINNWLLYYPIERWLARYTDVLITINKEDYSRAKKSFKAGRVEYIHGVGLDIDKFRNVIVNRIVKREEIGLPEDSFVVLSVGELNKNKNHEVIIKAIAKLNNPKIHYVICGKGPLENHLKELAEQLNNRNQVHLLGYRNDIIEIYKSCDVFAFPSLREGLGMAALEAMACGMPIITSNIHGILDYSVDQLSGFNCAPTDVDAFSIYIDSLMKNKSMQEEFGRHNLEIVKNFDINKIKKEMKYILNNY